MSDSSDSFMAVLLGMTMADQQSYQRIEPSEYDDRELVPQIDLDLPVHECYMQLIHTLAHRKTPEDYPLKKDCKRR